MTKRLATSEKHLVAIRRAAERLLGGEEPSMYVYGRVQIAGIKTTHGLVYVMLESRDDPTCTAYYVVMD